MQPHDCRVREAFLRVHLIQGWHATGLRTNAISDAVSFCDWHERTHSSYRPIQCYVILKKIIHLTSQPNYECIVELHQKAESIFLVRLVLEIELETDSVEPRFSFWVQSVIFEEVTLTEGPIAQ
jgi:hypothetical protein